MIAEYPELISAHISRRDKQKILQLVRERKFKNMSEVVRAALREFLSKYRGV